MTIHVSDSYPGLSVLNSGEQTVYLIWASFTGTQVPRILFCFQCNGEYLFSLPFCRAHLLLLPVSAGLVYNSALFPVDWSLPANSSCREAAIAFILLFHIESNDEATPTTKQQIIVISQSDRHH